MNEKQDTEYIIILSQWLETSVLLICGKYRFGWNTVASPWQANQAEKNNNIRHNNNETGFSQNINFIYMYGNSKFFVSSYISLLFREFRDVIRSSSCFIELGDICILNAGIVYKET